MSLVHRVVDEGSCVPSSIRPGDVLAGRYRLVDLLAESGGGRFWRAHDRVLERHVALHVIAEDDERADALMEAARRSATVPDRHLLRVLDADRIDGLCFVVNEWGSGESLDITLATRGPLDPRRAAWLVSEVAEAVAAGHEAGVAHGRLVPENVLVDRAGAVRIIGYAVDAALHGLTGKITTDVTDLGGLLYAALTAKWPGRSPSEVPPAPLVGGRVLRPRQVRAGIPRPLDALCDEVVNPYAAPGGSRPREAYDLASAAGIADCLSDFVGDPTGLAATAATGGPETVNLPPIADPPAAPEPTPEPPAAPTPVDQQPTQAGLPIFDDESDDVSWLIAPGEPPPPPPAFEDPPERPLFAPAPAGGGPARTPRRSDRAATPVRDEYWPWGDTGTGAPLVDPEEPEEVPGRSWLRLAAALAAGLLLLLAVVVAYNLGRGRTPLGSVRGDEPSTSPTTSAPTTSSAAPITDLSATDFDPQGDPPEENPDLAGLAVDGDPATAWRTQTYKQNLGPGGLKTGVGLILDLGAVHEISTVDLTFVGTPTGFSLYVTDEAPTAVADLDPVAAETADGVRHQVSLESPVQGRYLTVWLTSLPRVSDGFRGEVAEVGVK